MMIMMKRVIFLVIMFFYCSLASWAEEGVNALPNAEFVAITNDFEIMTTEVTQAQWYSVMEYNPSIFKQKKYCEDEYELRNGTLLCPNHPVEYISRNDIEQFLRKLNERNNDGYIYRLPREHEWELAARGGTDTDFYFGDDENLLKEYDWHRENSKYQTHNVSTLKPNSFGLYDVHGNVREQVDDSSSSISRGGSWGDIAYMCRITVRREEAFNFRTDYAGFRLARTKK